MKIKLEHLVKAYDGKEILKKLELDLKDIKVVGIIGKSGCGKSTLLRQMIGIELPNSGSVTINGVTVNEDTLKDYQKKVGVVFQKHNLFPHLSILENISLVLRKIKGLNKIEANMKSLELLKEFHLEDQANKKPSKISGGQAQRASIARAISTNPELLFLDEPTAALDPLLTKEVLLTIQLLKSKGAEFVFVTHEMDFLQKFADYFIFMDEGEIIEHGKIEKLKNPKTEGLRKLLE